MSLMFAEWEIILLDSLEYDNRLLLGKIWSSDGFLKVKSNVKYSHSSNIITWKYWNRKKKVFLNKYFRNCFFQAIFVRLQIISSDKKLTQNCYSTKSFARLKIL